VYRGGLQAGWQLLRPPTFKQGGGRLDHYLDWLLGELDARGRPVVLGGHSMGGALALLAAARAPQLVERLVLVNPAGLRLTKPMRLSAAAFFGQVRSGRLARSDAIAAIGGVVRAPLSALQLAIEVRALDLSRQMQLIRDRGTPVTVIGCSTDTLVTPGHCRRAAGLLGARYREVRLDGGHMWMLGSGETFGMELTAAL
jgi:pimeloyl-ACP methyl ester carboxylesterase